MMWAFARSAQLQGVGAVQKVETSPWNWKYLYSEGISVWGGSQTIRYACEILRFRPQGVAFAIPSLCIGGECMWKCRACSCMFTSIMVYFERTHCTFRMDHACQGFRTHRGEGKRRPQNELLQQSCAYEGAPQSFEELSKNL